jgi:phosphate transport system protein
MRSSRRLLSGDEPLDMHEAVAYSLLARHYKRVAAHLGNIATAALGRLDDLDFGPD